MLLIAWLCARFGVAHVDPARCVPRGRRMRGTCGTLVRYVFNVERMTFQRFLLIFVVTQMYTCDVRGGALPSDSALSRFPLVFFSNGRSTAMFTYEFSSAVDQPF